MKAPEAAAGAPVWALLCQRRCGASGLLGLIEGTRGMPAVLVDPFAAGGPWHELTRTFHAGRVEEAQDGLLAALASGTCFRHSLDGETREFNRLLAASLASRGHRVVMLTRELDTACAFSRIVAARFGLRGRAGLDRLRDRLESGAAVPRWDGRHLRARVRELVDADAAFAEDLAVLAPQALAIRFEALYRDGVHALQVLDELFRFLGIGQRGALLADHTALQALFFGEHHTHSLRVRHAELEALWIQIADELIRLRSTAP